ncbi:hypothetical protein LCGC14_3092520, partial [marine sediment metagenome]
MLDLETLVHTYRPHILSTRSFAEIANSKKEPRQMPTTLEQAIADKT